jgi:hypothetical protein
LNLYLGNIIENEVLKLSKIALKSSDSYECVADNGIGDQLRKVVNIYFSGKTFIESSDSTASQYQIDSQAKCGAFVVLKIVFFMSFLMRP